MFDVDVRLPRGKPTSLLFNFVEGDLGGYAKAMCILDNLSTWIIYFRIYSCH